MSLKLGKKLSPAIPVWVSPAEETRYEPAWILTYDDNAVAIRSQIGYAAGQEILIGMDTKHKENGRHGIEALLKAKIFWGRQVETEKDSYFEYQAKFILPGP
jgi:hypothetical protein